LLDNAFFLEPYKFTSKLPEIQIECHRTQDTIEARTKEPAYDNPRYLIKTRTKDDNHIKTQEWPNPILALIAAARHNRRKHHFFGFSWELVRILCAPCAFQAPMLLDAAHPT
jgi:hypothetical protein